MAAKESRAQKRERTFKLIENYFASGKKQRKFCYENQINYNNFQFWLKQYRNQHEKTTKETAEISRNFIPIQPQFTSNHSYPCVIEYPNGHKLLLNERPDLNMLRELLNLTGI